MIESASPLFSIRIRETTRMHLHEHPIDQVLVRQLLASQFPDWAALPLRRVSSAGTDNALFRLGEERVVRLPRIESAAAQRIKEHRWLPRLAPHLPLAVPRPLALGQPDGSYPWHWSVYTWLAGETVVVERLTDGAETAAVLAQFIHALQRLDTRGAPPPGAHNAWRGVPLAKRDEATRQAIKALQDTIDAGAALRAWEQAIEALSHDRPPVWLHGDLLPTNLLLRNGRLTAVLDFGCLGVGDPACDTMVAWTVLDKMGREAFREALPVDDATWLRGSGWALSFGLIALPYYQQSNPTLAQIARRTIEEVVAELV